MRKHLLKAAFALALSIGPALSAHAGLTSVNKVRNDEDGIAQILSNVYGGSFTKVGDDFTNGTITASRLSDTSDGFSLASGAQSGTDQSWSDGSYSARAVAKFSNYTQSFGTSDGSFANLFDVTGYGYDVTGGVTNINLSGASWARDGESGTHSSMWSDNEDLRDHLITYQISGLESEGSTWLMFWEDLTRSSLLNNGRTFSDFNDLVVELKEGTGAVAVPLPAAAVPGLVILGAMGIARKLRGRKTSA